MSEVTRRHAVRGALGANALNAESSSANVNPRLYTFVGGTNGRWSVLSIQRVSGDSLPKVQKLDVFPGAVPAESGAPSWALRGVTSNARYVTSAEKRILSAKQSGLDRPEATRAALIPIRKSAAWWDLTQDERRQIFEESSQHITIGLRYLPAIARRLHHCRDLSAAEPFDFLTWFDYAPEHSDAFEHMVAELRATEEWKFVEREVDIRLAR